MSAPAAAETGGRHLAGFYDTDEGRLRLVLRFLGEGAELGDRLFAQADLLERVRPDLPDGIAVTGLPHGADATPAGSVRTYQDALRQGLAESTSGRVRVVGDVVARAGDRSWEPWVRYEAALNDIFADQPLTALCLYDTRRVAPEVLADVRRAHPVLLTSEGPSPNGRYAEPHAFLAARSLPAADPLQQGPPRWELSDPAPREARRAVATLANDSALPPESVDSLVLATSEVVTNASLHGRRPVTVRSWSGPDAVVVAVHDGGAGPGYHEAGLVPKPQPGSGLGFGLWIAHLLCDEVVQHVDDSGFTVRLRMHTH